MEVVNYVIYNYSYLRNIVNSSLEMLTDIHLKFVEMQQNSSTLYCFAHWQG